jgi:hypothetical protein
MDLRALTLCLLTVAGCASAPIKGHEVADTEANRKVMSLVEAYRTAMQARDADKLAALVAEDYYEDNGDVDTANDYGRKELLAKLKARFAKTDELVLKIVVDDVAAGDEEIKVHYRYAVRYRLTLPAGNRWEEHRAENEMVLVRSGGRLLIRAGL